MPRKTKTSASKTANKAVIAAPAPKGPGEDLKADAAGAPPAPLEAPKPPVEGGKGKSIEEIHKTPVERPNEVTKAAIVGNSEKMVRVRGIANHECTIGKQRYFIIVDDVTTVPESVAAILANARKVVKL